MQPAEFGLGSLFASIHEAVIVVDAGSGRVIGWNPAAEAIFGYSASEALQLTVDEIVPLQRNGFHLAG
ncbi:MAG TPA: PAS domain-containing protein, partial [Dehalococcoidia bacterium]